MKDDTLKIALAHPNNTRMVGDERRTTYLLAIYPSLLITLSPGYFWYLSLHPAGVGQVDIMFGGGMSKDFIHDEDATAHITQLKTILDAVNLEDKGCTEKVYTKACALALPNLAHCLTSNALTTILRSTWLPGFPPNHTMKYAIS